MSSDTQRDNNFDAILRCKAPSLLVQRLQRLAKLRVKKSHELFREAVVRFVEVEERKLNLPPVDKSHAE